MTAAGSGPPLLRLDVAPGLRFFLRARHRAGPVDVRLDGTSSLGHVVESLGIPLTEVGALALVDRDGSVRHLTRAHRPAPGDHVEVHPVERPQPLPVDPPRFLLDVHLGTLARRLRLLGLDASYADNRSDADLVAAANAEQRLLLTQDRGLLRRRALRHGAYVRGADPEQQLDDVLDRFCPRLRPFTRCLACNGVVSPVGKADVQPVLQPGTRRSYDEFARCGSCGRVFWRGAHAARLEAVVRRATQRGG